MNSENKITVTSWNGKSWKMTPEQIEAAYRYREFQYRISDAKNQIELNIDLIEAKYGYSYDEAIEYAEELAECFNENFDCDVPENDAWSNCIEEVFSSLDRVGKIKQKLERNGYWIDELESSDGDIRICSNLSSLPMYFDSWKEIKEWIDEVAEID